MTQTGTTKVGRYAVPVKGAKFLSIVSFGSGAHGDVESGQYAFWTAVLKVPDGKKRGVWGRARLILPPGERFSRMAGKKSYKPIWVDLLKRGGNVSFVRPSTPREIAIWAKTHESDWKHVIWVCVKNIVYQRPSDLWTRFVMVT